MAALREQAEQLGVVMSGDAATAAADFADAQNELKSALQGVFLDIGVQDCPLRLLNSSVKVIAVEAGDHSFLHSNQRGGHPVL